MRFQRSGLRKAWPWLLIAVVLVSGPVLAACGSAGTAGTPTPTKTPRSAAAAPAVETAAAASTEVPPTGASAAAEATEAPSATPAPSETPEASPTAEDTATAEPTATTKAPVVRGSDSMASPDYGIQAFLWWRPEVADRDLGLIKDGGFTWVKQLFSWQDIEGAGKGEFDWTNTDRIVEQAEKHGLKLVVRLSQDPDRPFWAGAPPQNAGHFADFASAVAERYKGRIHAYQVWNEPNLAREWGGKPPDPKGYARMLQIAHRAIKSADPGALVITAGMAPTGTDNEIAMPDTKFYEQMYQAMGGNSDSYFDMLGVHAAGFAAAPEVSPDETAAKEVPYGGERFFAFRHVEDIRAIMEKYGDSAKRVAILEFGWTNDDRPESPYYWHGAGAGIDEEKKGRYLEAAFKYAEENWKPWIGLMMVIYMPDVNWTKDTEQYYWSVIGPGYPDLYLRAAYVILCVYLNDKQGKSCIYAPPG